MSAAPLTYAELQSYLARALRVLDIMSGEGVAFQSAEDPGDILLDFTERLGLDDWPVAIATLVDAA